MKIDPVSGTYTVNQQKISAQLSAVEQSEVQKTVDYTNKQTGIDGRQLKQTMDKNDFLLLLVTQLKNQDPSNPMEDKQFIAQMAQFSSLEQMSNMTGELSKLTGLLSAGQAYTIIGKEVEVVVGDKVSTGLVEEVTAGAYPQVLVNGSYYDYSAVSRVRQASAARE